MLASGDTQDSSIRDIFGQKILIKDVEKLTSTVILSPKNEDVYEINEKVLEIIERETQTYFSCDKIPNATHEENIQYSIEFLNKLRLSGMPSHTLKIKIGEIIMLLRNINTKKGLCNGRRILVTELRPNLIIGKLLTGSAAGDIIFIPRIIIQTQDTRGDLPFQLERRQFPVTLAFSMTLNKSQGQTMNNVGIYLPEPVFVHG